MRKQIIEHAAMEVATQVRAVEDTIDAALVEIAELQSRMARMRTVAPIGVATGHDAFEKLAGAVQALVGARGEMVGCHAALADAKTSIPGLRAVSFGDNECPPTGQDHLRIVA